MKGLICRFEYDGEKEWLIVKKKVTIHRTPAKFPRQSLRVHTKAVRVFFVHNDAVCYVDLSKSLFYIKLEDIEKAAEEIKNIIKG